MSLLFIDGCSHYSTNQIGRKYNNQVNTNGTITINNTTPRFTGSSHLRIVAGSFSSTYVVKTLAASATWVVGFAYRTSSIGGGEGSWYPLGIRDNGVRQVELKLNSNGTISITRNQNALTGGTSVLALSANTWYYIEWKVTVADSIGANTCQVYVNGIQWLNVTTGQDTKNTANATADGFYFGDENGSADGVTQDFTDIYIDNGTTFLGPQRVETLYPTGGGNSSQFTPSAGSNYQCVDETPPTDDTDYVESTTAGHIDTYAMGDLSSTPASIAAVQISSTDRKTDAGAKTINHAIRRSSTNYFGADIAQGDSYLINYTIWSTDPSTSAAWTASGINAAEVGQKLVA